jgi:hypothetical protein
LSLERKEVDVKMVLMLRLSPLVALAAAVTAFALSAGATTSATAKPAAPYCKTGQKSTKAHPCRAVPKCKTGQKSTKLHPCVKPKKTAETAKPATGSTTTATTTTATTTTTTASPGAGGQQIQANGCPVGQDIPQGAFAGDGDEDNQNGPDDGDGCT